MSVLPPRLCFSSKVVRKTRCSPAPAGLGVGKCSSNLSRISTAASPTRGCCSEGRGEAVQGGEKRAKSDRKRRGEEAAGANPIWPGAPSLSARVRLLAAIWRGCASGISSTGGEDGAASCPGPPRELGMRRGRLRGCAVGCSGGCAGGGWNRGSAAGCGRFSGKWMQPHPGGDAGSPRSVDAPPGRCEHSWARRMHRAGDAGVPRGGNGGSPEDGCTPGGGECTSFLVHSRTRLLCAAPRCPPKAGNVQSIPAPSPVCRGALQQDPGGL